MFRLKACLNLLYIKRLNKKFDLFQFRLIIFEKLIFVIKQSQVCGCIKLFSNPMAAANN